MSTAPSQAVAAPPLPAAPRSSRGDEDAVLKRFAQDISRSIGKSVSEHDYPRLARQSGWEGTPDVRLTIGSDGKLKSVEIATGSGHEVLDQHAIEMVKRIRLPKIPSAFREREFTVVVPIAFILKKQ
jgi:protein TonB